MQIRARIFAKSYFLAIPLKPFHRLLSGIVFFSFFLPHLASASTVLDDLASPVSTPARTPLLVGAGVTLGLLLLEDQIVDPAQKETVEDRRLGRFSKYGDYAGRLIPNGAYVLGMIGASAAGNENAMERAKIMALATIYSCSVSTLVKVTVREPRPNDGSDRKSFPSGHATAAFAFASVVGAEHGFGWGIPAYLLAGLVAFSRMNDNKHYLHDVVAGATMGIAYGLGTYYRHRDPKTGNIALLAPAVDGTHLGIRFIYAF